jgi:flagellar hook-length control protein FliK
VPASTGPLTATPAVSDQLAGALRDVTAVGTRGGERSHEVNLRLKPEELGTVAIKVRMSEDRIDLVVRCAMPDAVAAVQGSLTDLRRDLVASGFTAVDLTVRADSGLGAQPQSGNSQGGNGSPGTRPNHIRTPSDDAGDRPAAPGRPARSAQVAAGRVNLLL